MDFHIALTVLIEGIPEGFGREAKENLNLIAPIHNRMPVIIPRHLSHDGLAADADVKGLTAEADSNVRFELAA